MTKLYYSRRDGLPHDTDISYTEEDKALCELCVRSSHSLDLQRRAGNIPFSGPITPGAIFTWEPHSPHASEVIEVVESADDKVLTRSRQRLPAEIWVPIDRFREAVVLSRFKALPDRQGAI